MRGTPNDDPAASPLSATPHDEPAPSLVSTTPHDEPAASPAPAPASTGATKPEATRAPAGRAIQYRGSDLEAARGPGLGCFRFQLVVLAILILLTPLSVYAGWPADVSAALLLVTLLLLLFAGQTIIFLLRLVAAERRGRRRPLASGTPTVGELDDAARNSNSVPELRPDQRPPP